MLQNLTPHHDASLGRVSVPMRYTPEITRWCFTDARFLSSLDPSEQSTVNVRSYCRYRYWAKSISWAGDTTIVVSYNWTAGGSPALMDMVTWVGRIQSCGMHDCMAPGNFSWLIPDYWDTVSLKICITESTTVSKCGAAVGFDSLGSSGLLQSEFDSFGQLGVPWACCYGDEGKPPAIHISAA